MTSKLYIIGMMIKVIFVFLVIYYIIPSRIIHFDDEANKPLDKFFISFIQSNFVTIVLVHILVTAKIYETFSIIFSYFAVYMFIAWYRGRSPAALIDALGMQTVVYLLDISDGRLSQLKRVGSVLRRHFAERGLLLKKSLLGYIKNPFSGILVGIVLIGAAVLRFNHTIVHAAYPHIDMYVHLQWSKRLGLNQLYFDGVYPEGYHTIISAINKIFFIDLYWIVRYIGPIGGILLVLSTYYFVLRITKSHKASLISLVVYSLVVETFPGVMFRQGAALPQEYAAIFILPGLYMLFLYLTTEKNSFLAIYLQSLACTLLIHSYAALYLMIWSAILFLGTLLFVGIKKEVFLKLLSYGFITGVGSMLPIGIGWLILRRFHQSSIEFVEEGMFLGEELQKSVYDMAKSIFITGNPFLDIIIPGSIFLIMLLFVIKDKHWRITAFTVIISNLFMYLMYRGPEFNIFNLSVHSRTRVFFALILVIFYACGFNALEHLLSLLLRLKNRFRNVLIGVMSLVLCSAIIYYYPPIELYRGMEEYDAAAENYLKIKNTFPVMDWTIIGPNEQLAQALGVGWHSDVLRFIQKYSLQQAQDPEFQIPIPTHHIFAYTEKWPLNFERMVTEKDAQLELEPEGDDAFMQYYKNKDQRAILQAKTIAWFDTYYKNHQGVTIFYEDDKMRIYHIQHEPPENS